MRRLFVASGATAALAFAAWAWLPESPVEVAARRDASEGRAFMGAVSASQARPAQAPMSSMPSAAPPAHGITSVPITVTAPRQLLVGEVHELVVDLGANEGVGDIGFTAQFDANLLQVRSASEGNWAADSGVRARFAADISSGEDRVQVRSTVTGQRAAAAGRVAIVQFQAVAPGSTSLIVSDVVVRDRNGRSMPSAVAGASLQVVVDSVPTPPPGRDRPPLGAVAEPSAAPLDDDGD